MARMVEVQFYPQSWQNDYAVSVDAMGAATWLVEAEQVQGLKPDTYASDALRYHPNAPQWVQDWHGPFYIDWDTE